MYSSLINWETNFDTSHNTISHRFSDNVSIYTNLLIGCVYIVKDGSVIRKLDDMTLDSYHQLLVSTAKDVEQLNKFSR